MHMKSFMMLVLSVIIAASACTSARRCAEAFPCIGDTIKLYRPVTDTFEMPGMVWIDSVEVECPPSPEPVIIRVPHEVRVPVREVIREYICEDQIITVIDSALVVSLRQELEQERARKQVKVPNWVWLIAAVLGLVFLYREYRAITFP